MNFRSFIANCCCLYLLASCSEPQVEEQIPESPIEVIETKEQQFDTICHTFEKAWSVEPFLVKRSQHDLTIKTRTTYKYNIKYGQQSKVDTIVEKFDGKGNLQKRSSGFSVDYYEYDSLSNRVKSTEYHKGKKQYSWITEYEIKDDYLYTKFEQGKNEPANQRNLLNKDGKPLTEECRKDGGYEVIWKKKYDHKNRLIQYDFWFWGNWVTQTFQYNKHGLLESTEFSNLIINDEVDFTPLFSICSGDLIISFHFVNDFPAIRKEYEYDFDNYAVVIHLYNEKEESRSLKYEFTEYGDYIQTSRLENGKWVSNSSRRDYMYYDDGILRRKTKYYVDEGDTTIYIENYGEEYY